MKSILMTTSAVLLLTGLAAGQALAACPEELDAFDREYEETLQSAVPGVALTASEQAQLFGLRTAAENLHQSGDDETCIEVIRRANLVLESAIAPQVIRPEELVGREVTNSAEEKLGQIEDVMLDPVSGRIAYVVIEHGGFLGIGDDLFAVPWRAMQFLPGDDQKVILEVPEERLENAPRFSREDESPLERREWVTSVHTYYGVEPYWQDSVSTMALQYGGQPGAAPAEQPQTDAAAVPAPESGTGSGTEAESDPQPTGEATAVPPATEPATEPAAEPAGESEPAEQPRTEAETETEGQATADTQNLVDPQAGAPALVETQPALASPDAASAEIDTLVARIDDLEQRVEELPQADRIAAVEESITSLEQQVQQLSEQGPGEEVMQTISGLEEQVRQLSEQDDDLRQQIARLEEQIAASGDGGDAAADQRTAETQGGEPATVVIVPDPDTQPGEQQTDQQQTDQQQTGQQQTGQEQTEQQQTEPQQTEQQQTEQQQTEQQQTGQQPDQAGTDARQAEEQQEVAVQGGTTEAAAAEAPAGQPCEEQIAQLEEDLGRAEELGVAISDAQSEFKEAQAMLNNNSEALCRAAIKRAHDELIAVGFEPTELN